DRAAAGGHPRGGRAGADAGVRGRGRPRGPGGALRRPRGLVRDRRRAPPAPARRARRHRHHAAAGGRDPRLRGRARAVRPRHHGARGSPTIALLPGDGLGPEVMAAARELLDAIGEFDYVELLFGGTSIDAHGTALTDETTAACRAADAVLLAAVGGPKW